ncbi:MAG: hypothetical protein JNK64_03005 [Myxococcales bacterium]|nr:hypothetical protein [Myxococcales bacterium]
MFAALPDGRILAVDATGRTTLWSAAATMDHSRHRLAAVPQVLRGASVTPLADGRVPVAGGTDHNRIIDVHAPSRMGLELSDSLALIRAITPACPTRLGLRIGAIEVVRRGAVTRPRSAGTVWSGWPDNSPGSRLTRSLTCPSQES